jgi:AAA15 family ATPase/GTPase
VVLIDEIEGGIHFRAIREVTTRLLEAARQANVQVIATTHSLEAIDAVLEAVESAGIEDTVGYHVRRDDERHYVRRYDYRKLAALREGGLDLR